MYIYNTFLCIILPLHQITKCEGVSNTASMWGTVNVTSFALLTAVISLPQFFPFYWKSWKHYRRVFSFCNFKQMGMQKIYLWYATHSLLFKLTQLWRLPLLRNPETWKGPLFQIASSRFGSLSVHCGCHTETRYKAPHPMTETHFERQDS